MRQYLIAMKNGEIQIVTIINDELSIEDEISKFPQEIRAEIDYYRSLEDLGIPSDRTFRDAWCDKLEGERIDICLRSAKELALSRLRAERNKKLDELDKQTLIAIGKGDDAMRQSIESQKNVLRDATEPLKNLQVSGYNDEEVLASLKQLSVLE